MVKFLWSVLGDGSGICQILIIPTEAGHPESRFGKLSRENSAKVNRFNNRKGVIRWKNIALELLVVVQLPMRMPGAI
ncbi:MAG: hypothetical protein ACE5PV_00130 [Candidatus Poribacteria bacterium]